MAGELFQNGNRKYLTADERTRFLAAETHTRAVRTLCAVLAFSGYRISEALSLTVDRVDLAAGTLVFESLKKRRHGVFRAVPVPPSLLKDVDNVHGVRRAARRADRPFGARRSLGLRRDAGKPCLYRTGTAEELPVIIAAVVGIMAFLAPHPAPFSLQAFETQSLGVLVSFTKWLGVTAFDFVRSIGTRFFCLMLLVSAPSKTAIIRGLLGIVPRSAVDYHPGSLSAPASRAHYRERCSLCERAMHGTSRTITF